MQEMTAEDWHAVQHLAARIQYPPERITLLRRRLEANTPRHGAPLVLLAGRPKSGLELLLSRRLAPQIAAEVEKTSRPLVVGKTPDVVRPAIGSWATCKASRPGTGHFIVLRSAGEPPADTLAQIASLGYVDHAVLVTRLGQPLHIHERELAQSLAALVATVRVVVVGLPGEEATAAELAEVSAYAASQMRQAGFDDGRCLGAGIWFTDDQPHAGAITNVEDFLSIGATEASVGRSGMTQHALSALFTDMRRHAAAAPTPAVAAAALPEDQDADVPAGRADGTYARTDQKKLCLRLTPYDNATARKGRGLTGGGDAWQRNQSAPALCPLPFDVFRHPQREDHQDRAFQR